MDRSARFSIAFPVLALLCLAAPALSAQTAPAPETAATATPEPKKRSRPVSSELAATLAAGMPKYAPPKPVEPKPEVDEEDLPDLRDADKPRNKIIRLPEYVVREKKPPVFRERDLLGEEGRAELAKRRYAGLGLGLTDGPGLNQGVARYMMQEAARTEDMAAFSELTQTAAATDPEAAKYYKKIGQETYLRSSERVTGDDAWSNGR
jgi:hypothetical protein